MRGGIRRRRSHRLVLVRLFCWLSTRRATEEQTMRFRRPFSPLSLSVVGRNRPGRKRARRLVLGRLFRWLLTRRATGEQRTRCRRAKSRYARRNTAEGAHGLLLDRLFGWLSTRHATEEQTMCCLGLFRPGFSRFASNEPKPAPHTISQSDVSVN